MGLLNRVVGHRKVKSILIDAARRGRVATTYLFCGESGIGKKTVALELSKLLNCESPTVDHDACDQCDSCRKISSNKHPDITIIIPDGNVIKIEAIREVQEFLSLTPYEGRNKVVIIDDAHLMNQSASNAFLKTLEEPAPNCLIILVSSLPELLLETIRSRCFRINFSPLNSKETGDVLKRHLHMHGKETMNVLTKISMGRPGIVMGTDSDEILGEIEDFATSLLKKSVPDRIKDRAELEYWIDRILIMLRDMLLIKIHQGPEEYIFLHNLLYLYREISKKLDIELIIKIYNQLTEIKRNLKFNINLSIAKNYIESSLNAQY